MALNFDEQHNHRGFDKHDTGFPSTTDRAPPLQNQPWHMVKSKQAAKVERREARGLMDLSKVWAVPITSRISNYATKENHIPLGNRAAASDWCQSLQRPLCNSQPHFNHAGGFIKPTGVGGATLQHQHQNFKVTEPTPVIRSSYNSMNNYAPKERRNHYVLKSVTSNLDCIKISTPSVALELRNYCQENGIFAKWGGNGQPLAEIAKWWKDAFQGQVSITTLANNFLYIECHNKSLKMKLLFEEFVFYNGVNFKFIDWHSEFDANKFEFKNPSKWIEIRNVPVELMHAKILIEIGDKLGKFIAVEVNWMNPNRQKPQAPKPDKPIKLCNRVNIQFNNDIGGFIINANPQEENNHATSRPPSDPQTGNSPNKTEQNNNEEFVEEVYNDAPTTAQTLGNKSTQASPEENALVSPNLENSSPVVDGLNEKEEREFIIKELINMQEGENNLVMNNK
ncbi:hypothetical protein SUGI_1028390 [Cryptomeria japonica]|nr:hypothetical protein SUGI_1028390 [Cryptomeria japonica]